MLLVLSRTRTVQAGVPDCRSSAFTRTNIWVLAGTVSEYAPVSLVFVVASTAPPEEATASTVAPRTGACVVAAKSRPRLAMALNGTRSKVTTPDTRTSVTGGGVVGGGVVGGGVVGGGVVGGGVVGGGVDGSAGGSNGGSVGVMTTGGGEVPISSPGSE